MVYKKHCCYGSCKSDNRHSDGKIWTFFFPINFPKSTKTQRNKQIMSRRSVVLLHIFCIYIRNSALGCKFVCTSPAFNPMDPRRFNNFPAPQTIQQKFGKYWCRWFFNFKGDCWSKNCFAHFPTQSFHCIFIMISMKKYGEKTKINFFSAVGFHGNGGHIRF